MYEFRERLKELREEKGLSKRQLGTMLKVSDTSVSKWERGKMSPSLDVLLLLADFFNVSLDYLAGRVDE